MSTRHRFSNEQWRGLAVIAVGAILLLLAFTGATSLLGGAGSRTVRAQFAQANEVNDSTPVRLGGVDVGTVSSLEAAPDHTTSIVMSISNDHVQLHRDASAQIRWRNLLGGSMYIDLHPGSSSAPPLNGAIPLSRTSSQVDWDQFNNQFPAATRPNWRRMLAGLNQGLSAPQTESQTLRVFGPALAQVGKGSDALRGQQIGDLTKLVQSTATTLHALSLDSGDLQRLVRGADQTLQVTATHNQALAQIIELSPPALDSTLTSTRHLDSTLAALDPVIVQLQPGASLIGPTTDVLNPMLQSTQRVLRDSTSLFQHAPTTLRLLGEMSRQGTPLFRGLNPTLVRLNDQLIPFLGRTDPDTKLRLYETFGPLASDLSSSVSPFDANGHLLNFNVQLDTGSLLLPCDTGPAGTSVSQCLVPASSLAGLFRRTR